MTGICHYCGSPVSSNFCTVCGNHLHPSAEIAPGASGSQGIAEPLASGSQEKIEKALAPVLQKAFGIGDFINALMTLHTPLKGVRKLIDRGGIAVTQAFLAYVEFLTIVPFVFAQIIHPLSSAVGYPLVYQGSATESTVLFYFVAALSGAIALLAIYLLPNSLFSPRTKPLVIAVNLYMAMYATAYLRIGDFFEIGAWSITNNLMVSSLLNTLVFTAVLALHYFILRRLLSLSWVTTVICLTLSTLINVGQAYMLVELGLIKLN